MTLQVLYDDVIFNEQRHGGISRYFSQLLCAEEHGCAFTPRTTCRVTRNEHLAQAAGFDGWVLPDRLPLLRKSKRLRRVNSWLSRRSGLWNTSDVYHQTFYSPRYMDRRGTMPMVVTVHDMIPERYPQGSARQRRRHEHKRAITEQADAVICVSQTTAQLMADHYNVREDRIHICYHGIDADRFVDVPQPVRPMAQRYVIYVGLRAGYKSFRTLVEAIGLLRDIPNAPFLLCVGGGPMEDEFRRRLEELGIAQRVKRVDADHAALVAAYRNAAAFVYPAIEEGFGIPILEAWACDCPCVLADQPTFGEVAGDAASYFAPCDAHALAQILRTIADDTWPADSLRGKGRQRLARYTLSELLRQTAGVYQSLV